MQVLSFKNTALFKRGLWLSMATLVVFAASPFVLDGRLWRQPGSSLIGVDLLVVLFGFLLWRTRFHLLTDEVIDAEVHLVVRRGKKMLLVLFSNIASAEVMSFSGVHRIVIRLHEATPLGKRIEFLPQASLWSNLPAVQRIAASLANRASQIPTMVRDPRA
ncbi:MAG: hypothetical protein QOF42_3116 [Gammaproteobacteria bacterium]|nr:hypothetical protein [Gammaproteobacteria bacterium]